MNSLQLHFRCHALGCNGMVGAMEIKGKVISRSALLDKKIIQAKFRFLVQGKVITQPCNPMIWYGIAGNMPQGLC